MQRVVREQRLGFVATVTPDGRPNLSPKGTTGLWDDERLFFADIASPGTVANLRANPHVEVNVVDPILRKGFRFKGTAIIYTSGEGYDRGLELLRKQGSTATRERVRSIVVIEVTEAGELTSRPTTTAPPSRRSPSAGSGTTPNSTAPRGSSRAERRHRRPLRPRPSAGGGARRFRRVAQWRIGSARGSSVLAQGSWGLTGRSARGDRLMRIAHPRPSRRCSGRR